MTYLVEASKNPIIIKEAYDSSKYELIKIKNKDMLVPKLSEEEYNDIYSFYKDAHKASINRLKQIVQEFPESNKYITYLSNFNDAIQSNIEEPQDIKKTISLYAAFPGYISVASVDKKLSYIDDYKSLLKAINDIDVDGYGKLKFDSSTSTILLYSISKSKKYKELKKNKLSRFK